MDYTDAELREVGVKVLQVAGKKSGIEVSRVLIHLRLGSLVACLSLLGCSNDKGSADRFLAEELVCPSPAIAEFQAWGKSGMQHVCKIKHGPFIAWESGYVHVRGQFENGKETGVWYWYDKDGNVEKKIDYGRKDNPRESSK